MVLLVGGAASPSTFFGVVALDSSSFGGALPFSPLAGGAFLPFIGWRCFSRLLGLGGFAFTSPSFGVVRVLLNKDWKILFN